MPEQRQAYRVGNSIVVAVPRRVREHLALELGAPLYWFTVRKGEAVLTTRAARTGGHPEGIALQRRLDQAHAEIERLRRRLATRDLAVLHEGKSAGWAEAMRYYAKLDGDLTALVGEVRALAARLPFRRRSRARPPQVVAGVGLPPGVVAVDVPPGDGGDDPPAERQPSPDSPSPDTSSGGDAASGGEAPQAAHS